MGCGSSVAKPTKVGPAPIRQEHKKEDGTLDREALLTFIFGHCDDDNDGKVSMVEFRQLAEKQDQASIAVQDAVFASADKNGDGELSLAEFKQFNLEAGASMSDEEFNDSATRWLTVRRA